MKKILLTLTFMLHCSLNYALGSLTIFVDLSPAGSFEIKSKKVKGKAIKTSKGKFIAKGVSVKTKTLMTGLELRDGHLHDKLEVKKFKKIEILDGEGANGKGSAIIRIKKIEKKVTFDFKEKEGNLVVTFPLNLNDFKFSGINYLGVGVKNMVKVEAIVPIK